MKEISQKAIQSIQRFMSSTNPYISRMENIQQVINNSIPLSKAFQSLANALSRASMAEAPQSVVSKEDEIRGEKGEVSPNEVLPQGDQPPPIDIRTLQNMSQAQLFKLVELIQQVLKTQTKT